jgi:hypothetical protein
MGGGSDNRDIFPTISILIMNKIFKFENLVGISALFVAGCAAYYSIIGISTLFSGSFVAAMIMSFSLELGKLTATSYLFRFWQKTQLYLRVYLIMAVLILSLITSLGIFGYLSGAYQSSAMENQLSEEKISTIESQREYSQSKIVDARKQIEQYTKLRSQQENRMDQSVTNLLIARNPIEMEQLQEQTKEMIDQNHTDIEAQNQIIQNSTKDLENLDSQISDIQSKIGGKKDMIIFKFVADAVHMSMNSAVKWFILLLISVFDPLALCLLLAYNTSITKEKIIPLNDIIEPPLGQSIVNTIAEPVVSKIEESITGSVQPSVTPPPKTRQLPAKLRGMFSF